MDTPGKRIRRKIKDIVMSKERSIEKSSRVNFTGRQTMVQYSEDGRSYRGRVLAMSDDEHFLERIEIGPRCCLILPPVVSDSDNKGRDNGDDTSVDAGPSGDINSLRENETRNNSHDTYVEDWQGNDQSVAVVVTAGEGIDDTHRESTCESRTVVEACEESDSADTIGEDVDEDDQLSLTKDENTDKVQPDATNADFNDVQELSIDEGHHGIINTADDVNDSVILMNNSHDANVAANAGDDIATAPIHILINDGLDHDEGEDSGDDPDVNGGEDARKCVFDDFRILVNDELDYDGDEDSGDDPDVNGGEDARKCVFDDFRILVNDELDYDGDEDAGAEVDHYDPISAPNNAQGFDGDEDAANDIDLDESVMNVPADVNGGDDARNCVDDFFILMNDELDYDEDEDEVNHDNIIKVPDDDQGFDRDEDATNDIDFDESVMNVRADVNGGEDARYYVDDDNDDVLIRVNDELCYDEDEDAGAEVDHDEIINTLNNEQGLDKNEDTTAFGPNDEPVEQSVDGDGDLNNYVSGNPDGQAGPSVDLANKNLWNRGGRHRVEIMANTGVFIDKRELTAITRKYGKDTREMERKLFLEILGEETLKKMTRTGRHQKGQSREKVPKDVLDAVRDYMDDEIEENHMSRAEFEDVLTSLCNRLRHPRR